MTGSQNPAALANALAAHQLAVQSANAGSNSHVYYQARLCSDCWLYWKKYAGFKYPNARYERQNQLKNQVHKCSVNGCGREFKIKQLLVKHCGIAHGYFAKTSQPVGPNNQRPAAMRNRTSFCLFTTPMTQAARNVCVSSIKLKKLARKPFKLVDLAELNKEWYKETRNISQILETSRKRRVAKKRVLSKILIEQIHKAFLKFLKKKKKRQTNGEETETNEADVEVDDEDDEVSNELVIDNEEDKPEFLKYFENKCTSPCFTPEKLAFPKPNPGKFTCKKLFLKYCLEKIICALNSITYLVQNEFLRNRF